MESLYKFYPIKTKLDFFPYKARKKDSCLIRRYVKKVVLFFCFLILASIPIALKHFFKTPYITSILTIVIIYPLLYGFYRIDKWAMNSKYMP